MSLHTGMPSAHVSSDHSGPGSKPQSARGGAAQVFLGREVAIPKGSNREPDVGTNLGRGGTSGQEPVSCHRTYTSSVRTCHITRGPHGITDGKFSLRPLNHRSEEW